MKSNPIKDRAFGANRTYELMNSQIAYELSRTRLAPWCSGYFYFKTSYNKDSAQVGILLALYRMFAVMRTSDNGLGWK